MIHPPIHVLVYAPPGNGKSHFAASFPKDMLVLAFDPKGKMTPYYDRGIAPLFESDGPQGQGIEQVMSRRDPSRAIIQIEYFHDDQWNPDGTMTPVAYEQFLARAPSLYDEIREGRWQTVVIDTTSAMRMASHNLHRYKLNKKTLEPRQWDSAATNDLEQALACRLTSLRCNLVVLAHVDHKDTDEFLGEAGVKQPALPGRLSRADQLPAKYPEMYTIRVKREQGSNAIVRTLQTQPGNRFNCMSTQINAPDGVSPDYKNLWANYDAKHGGV